VPTVNGPPLRDTLGLLPAAALNVAVALELLGTVCGVQLVAVFQLLVPGLVPQVAFWA